MSDRKLSEEEVRLGLGRAIAALRALNSAVWLDYPSWALARFETAQATEVIATYEARLSE